AAPARGRRTSREAMHAEGGYARLTRRASRRRHAYIGASRTAPATARPRVLRISAYGSDPIVRATPAMYAATHPFNHATTAAAPGETAASPAATNASPSRGAIAGSASALAGTPRSGR